MHSEPLRTVLGEGGLCCQRELLPMTSYRLLLLHDLMVSASPSREELQLAEAMAAAAEALPMQPWMNALSFVTPLTLSATKRCTAPLQRACSQVVRSS